MKSNDFSVLCSLIRRSWTKREGVILRMRKLGSSDPDLLLCVGGARNPDLTARECIVWSGDAKIYDGQIESEDLCNIITDAGVCYCEITNARLMEHDASGTFACLMLSNKDCPEDCPLKQEQDKP